jgi:hypothetical protein
MRLKKARHAIVKASRAWPEVDRLRENPSDRDQNPIGGFQFPDILENELGRPLEIESEREMDARRFLEAMRERFESFSLSLHPEKTRLIEFGRFAAANRKRRGLGKPETFQFLGFSFICGKTGQLGGDADLLVRLVDVDLGPAKPAQSPGSTRTAQDQTREKHRRTCGSSRGAA